MNWKAIVSNVAPNLGAALGGPLGAMAGRIVSTIVAGKEAASDKEMEAAMASADPEVLLKLKQADLDFQSKMAELGVQLEKLEADDRASARQREVAIRDWVPATLAISTNLAFFMLLWLVLTHSVPDSSKSAFDILLGILGTGTASVWSYYFGSSSGSRAKDVVLGKMAGK